MATYTKSLTQKAREEDKEQEKHYKFTIKNNLRLFFQVATEDGNYNEKIIDLLENRLEYADKLAHEIYNLKNEFNKRLFDNYGIDDIFNDILKNYNNELAQFKKTYTMEQKAKKDYYSEKLYNIVNNEIKKAKKKGAKIENIRKAILTSDYKKIMFEEMQETTRHFDKKIFDDVYNLTINKVLRTYKNDETMEEEHPQQIKIPLGWKVYGISKAISKITGAKL